VKCSCCSGCNCSLDTNTFSCGQASIITAKGYFKAPNQPKITKADPKNEKPRNAIVGQMQRGEMERKASRKAKKAKMQMVTRTPHSHTHTKRSFFGEEESCL